MPRISVELLGSDCNVYVESNGSVSVTRLLKEIANRCPPPDPETVLLIGWGRIVNNSEEICSDASFMNVRVVRGFLNIVCVDFYSLRPPSGGHTQ